MRNKIIRVSMIEAGLKQWELAKLLGVSESVLSRKLREELPLTEQEEIVAIIENNKRG